MITRRRFLQASAATGAMLAWPIRAFPFSQSTTPIMKFKVTLPGLVIDGDTARGIPFLSPDTTTIPGTDLYEIEADEFTQDLLGAASSLGHPTKLWGYASVAHKDRQYLGGVIVATRGTPVQLRVTNKLPGKHILPVDLTLLDPEVRNEAGMTRQDKLAVHLHGGLVFWQVDGGPFTWYTNPANGGFEHGTSFIIGDPSAEGTAIYDYPNDQSARTIWYHDHAYGLTRTNVFAGLASAYLITDPQEQTAIANGVFPGGTAPFNALTKLGIPLIVQDKTFWDPAKGDPDYGTVPPAGAAKGDLWYPHVYEGGLDPEGLPGMGLPSADADTGNHKRWGTTNPSVSNSLANSSVPEYFSDTILVNGAPYPTLTVEPRRYRFRFVNASQARFYNLQLYVADDSTDGITLVPISTGELDPNGNVLLVPDPSVDLPGPAFVQIASEAGFLPAPALFTNPAGENINSNLVLKFGNLARVRLLGHRKADSLKIRSYPGAPGDPTLGNPTQHNLLMAPAERPDVIIDFRGFEDEDIILYNDAPAPFPGGDVRNDYFVLTSASGLAANYNDLTSIGGAPPTLQGEGPDTRILMKFQVRGTRSMEPDFATWVGTVNTELPKIFAATQPGPLSGGRTIVKTLGEDNDEFGRLRQYLGNTSGNLRTYLDFPSEVAVAGEVQTWQIFNLTADTHPMHFHLVNVEVLSREQWDFNPDGTPVLPLSIIPNSNKPVDANEKGWKETVRMNPGEVTTIRMKFDLPGTPDPSKFSPRLLATYGIKGSEYVWHCHILEHEEHDMMRPIVVVS